MKKYKLPHLGILNYEENGCVGGAEFVPSEAVPYNVPKNSYTAFLTCSYLSNEDYDYKSYPLMILEKDLKNIGYKKIEAVVSEKVVFPNSTLSWFIERGYKDLGEIYNEEKDFEVMHLY